MDRIYRKVKQLLRPNLVKIILTYLIIVVITMIFDSVFGDIRTLFSSENFTINYNGDNLVSKFVNTCLFIGYVIELYSLMNNGTFKIENVFYNIRRNIMKVMLLAIISMVIIWVYDIAVVTIIGPIAFNYYNSPSISFFLIFLAIFFIFLFSIFIGYFTIIGAIRIKRHPEQELFEILASSVDGVLNNLKDFIMIDLKYFTVVLIALFLIIVGISASSYPLVVMSYILFFVLLIWKMPYATMAKIMVYEEKRGGVQIDHTEETLD